MSLHHLLLLASTLCVGLGTTSVPDLGSVEPRTCALSPDDGDEPIDIKGPYRWVGDDEHWVYFMLGDKGIAIKKAAFPNPPPLPGQQMTATGCVPDPGWPGGYICTGLQ